METTPQIDNHLKANMNMSKKDIIVGNFLGGIAWGFGTVIGAGVVVAIIGAILGHLGIFNFLSGLSNQLPQAQQLK